MSYFVLSCTCVSYTFFPGRANQSIHAVCISQREQYEWQSIRHQHSTRSSRPFISSAHCSFDLFIYLIYFRVLLVALACLPCLCILVVWTTKGWGTFCIFIFKMRIHENRLFSSRPNFCSFVCLQCRNCARKSSARSKHGKIPLNTE